MKEPDRFSNGNDGPQGYADIDDGRFDTRDKGKGAFGGPTIAVIEGFERSTDPTPGFVGDPIFAKFEIPVDLPKENCQRDFEVPASAADNLPKGPRGPRL